MKVMQVPLQTPFEDLNCDETFRKNLKCHKLKIEINGVGAKSMSDELII